MVFGTVIWTFVCALFGAIFGYILGLMIELFPGVNAALLNGLHVTSMPALLAALGLVAGTLLGILISALVYYAWTGKYAKYFHNWSHGDGRRYVHGHHHFRRYGHYYESACGPWSNPVEDSLSEIDGYVSYLEDMPKDRLEACDERISRLNERLSNLKASLNKNRSG
ncbi:MAG TPA: hypothetical protein VMC84_11385 [Methanocella sp.]|uniref:hypothetical protein n=1 Tax=Methanocella sp. TaxID=2052833 RepID=UPI002C91C71C|nr:hypothetical protein [Methanocella sp.]HTY91769.1 hypothetical protein [Methanocella sp.]